MQYIKNVAHAQVFEMANEVAYQKGQVVSKTLAQDAHHSLTLFAFDEGEEISSHDSKGDALVFAMDGEGLITIDGKEYALKAGEAIVMPATIPHAVYATKQFKMLLIVIFPQA